MKLLRFGAPNQERPAVLHQGNRLDCSGHFADWNRDFFLNDGLNQLQQLLATEVDSLPVVDPKERWGACISRPAMILCIGLNYADHAKESGMDIPKEPVIFMKASNTLSGPYDDVAIPRGSSKTDWEVELAFVLKKDVSYLSSLEEAREAIAGYCIMHDVSEREFQLERSGQWVKGKSCPGFSPVGPFLATADEMNAVDSLGMELYVNGRQMQRGNTRTMVFQPDFLVHYLSQFMKLEAGDLITTGTPPGVGLGMNPPQYLTAGDVVELTIQGLGSQRQSFV